MIRVCVFAVVIAAVWGQNYGNCPQPAGPGVCAQLCTNDAACGYGRRCCSNGCGHECVQMPPTQCPSLVCQLSCTDGYAADQNGCRICACHYPCATIRCKAGYQCRGVPVMCIRAPCLTVGQCYPVSSAAWHVAPSVELLVLLVAATCGVRALQ